MRLDDGRCLIETQDFRSSFALADFCAAVSAALSIPIVQIANDRWRLCWRGAALDLAHEDAHGCFIEGHDAALLHALAQLLTHGEP